MQNEKSAFQYFFFTIRNKVIASVKCVLSNVLRFQTPKIEL